MKRLILNDPLTPGLWAVRGESGALWVLDWQGRSPRQSRAVRIRGHEGNVGYDDNHGLGLAHIIAVSPDDQSADGSRAAAEPRLAEATRARRIQRTRR